MSTKINLHELFEKRAEEQADEHAFSGKFSNNNDECGNAYGSFKAGYTAALNDLQGKVDGLLVALETIPLCAGISTEDGPKASVIAKKALAEFKKETK